MTKTKSDVDESCVLNLTLKKKSSQERLNYFLSSRIELKFPKWLIFVGLFHSKYTIGLVIQLTSFMM